GFFEVQHLKPLSEEQGILMLQRLAQAEGNIELVEILNTPAGRARVRALQHLAQGNHRVLIIFYDFLNDNFREDLLGLLWKTIDALTPYYQSFSRAAQVGLRKLSFRKSKEDNQNAVI